MVVHILQMILVILIGLDLRLVRVGTISNGFIRWVIFGRLS